MIKRFFLSPAVWVGLIQLVLLGVAFDKVLFQPSKFYSNNSYDGIRTMYVVQTYVEGNHSYGHYEYMNYPYGEQLGLTGATPVFSVFLKLLYQSGILSDHWVLPAFYGIVLISIPITAFFLYMITLFFLKKKWPA